MLGGALSKCYIYIMLFILIPIPKDVFLSKSPVRTVVRVGTGRINLLKISQALREIGAGVVQNLLRNLL